MTEQKLSVWSTTTPSLTQQQMFSARARKDILMSSAIAAGLVGSRVFVTSGLDVFRDEDLVDAYFERGLSPPVVAGFDEGPGFRQSTGAWPWRSAMRISGLDCPC